MTDTDAVPTDADAGAKVNGHPLEEVREAVLHAAKKMYERGLVEGTAGNVSGRVDDGTVVLTPSSLSYEAMTLDDLVQLTLDGEVLAGERSPTSEKALHLSTLALHPEVGAVVHCHAKYASMYAVARQPIPAAIDEFVTYIGGDVPVCEYHQSGSDGLAEEVASRLGDRSAALMANHGMVAVGKNVDDALHSAMVVEHNAQIMWGAAQLPGGIVELPDKARTDFANVYDFIRNHMWMS